MFVIEQLLPAAPAADSEAQVLTQWNAVYDAYNDELKSMFEKKARVERFDLIQTFHACKQEEGKLVGAYVLKMKDYIEQLERLGYVLSQDISVGLILNGLTSNFVGFVRNCNMHNMDKTIGELHALLIEYEKGLSKKAATPQVMAIQGGRIQKANKKSLNAKGKCKGKGKGKDKPVYIPKPKNPKISAKEHPTKDDACHHYKEVVHWKKNCSVYLVELIKKKKQVGTASSSGIFTIELFSFPNKSWVYDTSCGTHICNTKHGLRGVRKLKQGALYLYVGNGIRAQVEAIGSYDLILPNGLVICLDNSHYAPTITRGVVSVSRLVDNGFTQCFMDYGISVSKNNVLYFNAISSNGIYEIDMINCVPNVNSIYTVSNKRAKHNLDSTYLWHCRLAHISKKRIEKLQHDGILKSTDEESFDQCVSCLSGKMTRKPFPHRTERATDLLRIIHTDVCGPLRHVSRQGASYFITFMDDYSRYGYVYLLKHKHEVFETFKVFKNEVENQLGKTIKALRLDRGGEYISQEFKDYLKACGIVQQLTPPYTPQHNGVSERRNRTLLDMIRSKMNLTTLPLSFWDYALETATRILNMVPTKKVDKTPYELWIPKRIMCYYFYFPPENKIVVASEIPTEVEGFEPPQKEVVLVHRSARTHRAPDHLCLNVEVREHSLGDLDEPANYKAAILDPESDKLLGSSGFFKKKTNMDGIVHTYKARLVAKGYTQTFGVDYEETLSPIADIRAIRILIAIAAKVCKLQRSICGLKQASRSWNKRFDEKIKRFGFGQNLDEPCVYQKASGSNVTFLILYVDDIIIMGNHILSLQSVESYLGKCFAIKDLGEATYIIGIKIYRDRSKRLIGLSQSAYMDKILKRFRMNTSKRGYIPMQEKLDLNKTQGTSTLEEVKYMQNVPYASVVGSIMYATAVKTILKYLRNTKDMFLVYGGNPEAKLRVDCYCDVGFETDRDDTKSQTRYVFILNGGAIDWKSSKQILLQCPLQNLNT
ncbi:retrotransposon protein, putative, ty1-copia subclass [Tanacetum coccineum]